MKLNINEDIGNHFHGVLNHLLSCYKAGFDPTKGWYCKPYISSSSNGKEITSNSLKGLVEAVKGKRIKNAGYNDGIFWFSE